MAYFSPQELDKLRAKADIVDVISHYLQVQKKGRSYRAVCPFHDDHDPPMNINPQRQIYKCFVCGAGGNVFGFVQNYEKVSFAESVEKVADLVGFTLSQRPAREAAPADPHKTAMYRTLKETIQFTMYELGSEEGSAKREYLRRRGIDEETVQRFQIGWNPGHDALYRFLHAKGYSDREMTDVNVARLGSDGFHDVFADRITFPIHDLQGNPVGFSARTLDPQNPSKYINTTETEIYVKGRLVYNAHRARAEARRQGKIYLCEGVTDVIAFDRAGIPNAVCTLGTACTNEQLAVIRRLAPQLVFCYDGDQAGQNATWRGIQMARSLGCSVSVVNNQTGQDPDEIIRENGAEALRRMVSQEVSWMEFYLRYEKNRTNLQSYLEKKEFIEKVQKQISTLEDEVDRRYFTERLSEMTGIRLDAPVRQKEREFHVQKPVRTSVPLGIRQAEDQILIMMLKSPSAARVFEDELGYLIDPFRQRMAVMILECIHRNGRADINALLDQSDDPQISGFLTGLVSSEQYDLEYDEMMLAGAIRKVKRSYLENQADAYREQLKTSLNPESRSLIMKQYTECVSQLRRYIDEECSK